VGEGWVAVGFLVQFLGWGWGELLALLGWGWVRVGVGVADGLLWLAHDE
jgi:hypothetical protein